MFGDSQGTFRASLLHATLHVFRPMRTLREPLIGVGPQVARGWSHNMMALLKRGPFSLSTEWTPGGHGSHLQGDTLLHNMVVEGTICDPSKSLAATTRCCTVSGVLISECQNAADTPALSSDEIIALLEDALGDFDDAPGTISKWNWMTSTPKHSWP